MLWKEMATMGASDRSESRPLYYSVTDGGISLLALLWYRMEPLLLEYAYDTTL